MNIDKLMDLNLAFKQMPEISPDGSFHSFVNTRLPTRLPKNWTLGEMAQNEKFLNNSQSLIEEFLPKKQLEHFIKYQNWNFKFGMGETKRNRKLYTDTTELTKENLFKVT